LKTSFAARTGTSGPEVIICAEYEALPEVGHACGHNLIASSSVGAGIALAGLAEELGCRITVLGTPAEESYGGKVDLIQAGAFTEAAVAMMVHPTDRNILDPFCLAIEHLDVHFYGKESHAAASPQKGINALDAAVAAYTNIALLRQALYPTDKVNGIITHGGNAPNVVPAYAAMSWYVRAASEARLAELQDKVLACLEAAASATDCRMEVERQGHRFLDLITNPLLAELFAENARALGRDMKHQSDYPIDEVGSTDMGNVSHQVPSIHPELTINPGKYVNHQKEYAAHTISSDGEQTLRDAALAMAWTTIDLAQGNRWDELKARDPGL
jgi:amidohydrolase